MALLRALARGAGHRVRARARRGSRARLVRRERAAPARRQRRARRSPPPPHRLHARRGRRRLPGRRPVLALAPAAPAARDAARRGAGPGASSAICCPAPAAARASARSNDLRARTPRDEPALCRSRDALDALRARSPCRAPLRFLVYLDSARTASAPPCPRASEPAQARGRAAQGRERARRLRGSRRPRRRSRRCSRPASPPIRDRMSRGRDAVPAPRSPRRARGEGRRRPRLRPRRVPGRGHLVARQRRPRRARLLGHPSDDPALRAAAPRSAAAWSTTPRSDAARAATPRPASPCTFNNADEDGRHYRERVIDGKAYRYYADEGRRLGSVWTDIPAMVANTPLRTRGHRLSDAEAGAAPRADRPRLERARAHVVADLMCGSGTTPGRRRAARPALRRAATRSHARDRGRREAPRRAGRRVRADRSSRASAPRSRHSPSGATRICGHASWSRSGMNTSNASSGIRRTTTPIRPPCEMRPRMRYRITAPLG